MKLIYIAGPFRGATQWDIEINVHEAALGGMKVAEAGGVPVIPHTMYRAWNGTLDDQFWLDATREILRRCDGLALLAGWDWSAGARAEREEAVALGMPIIELANTLLEEWIRDVVVERAPVSEP